MSATIDYSKYGPMGLDVQKKEPGIIVATLNRPDKRNAINASLHSALEEFLQVRMALEGTTAALAAQRATLPQVAAIRRGLDAMRQAAADTDWDGLIQSEVIFHRALLEASNNTLLLSLLANLTAWLTEVGRAVRSIPDRRYDVVALH